MGIQNLLPQLAGITNDVHISKYKGKTVAIDGYVWLHRGVFSCAKDICLEKRTTRYINYFMHRIKMLLYHKVSPYVVFDGGLLPSKMGKEDERAERRAKNLKAGQEFTRQGIHHKAMKCFAKAVDVTPTMAYQVIKKLKELNVKYVVAPYEADAQLAHLYKRKKVDAIISEDSDLLTYGCRTVLFKNGQRRELQTS
eukprot:UN24610